MAKFQDLLGKVITKIEGDKYSEELYFHCQDGSEYKMYHEQDCCESVSIEDIDGDMSRLLGLPITIAEETSNSDNAGQYGNTCTWTFYKLGNVIDTVTIRWYGESNGYYSESANFIQTKEADKQEAQMDKIYTLETKWEDDEDTTLQYASADLGIVLKNVEELAKKRDGNDYIITVKEWESGDCTIYSYHCNPRTTTRESWGRKDYNPQIIEFLDKLAAVAFQAARKVELQEELKDIEMRRKAIEKQLRELE